MRSSSLAVGRALFSTCCELQSDPFRWFFPPWMNCWGLGGSLQLSGGLSCGCPLHSSSWSPALPILSAPEVHLVFNPLGCLCLNYCFTYFCPFLVISGEKISPVPVPPSWPESKALCPVCWLKSVRACFWKWVGPSLPTPQYHTTEERGMEAGRTHQCLL